MLETVADSIAICEIVLMGMIVADRRSARTPILARNSLSARACARAGPDPHFSQTVRRQIRRPIFNRRPGPRGSGDPRYGRSGDRRYGFSSRVRNAGQGMQVARYLLASDVDTANAPYRVSSICTGNCASSGFELLQRPDAKPDSSTEVPPCHKTRLPSRYSPRFSQFPRWHVHRLMVRTRCRRSSSSAATADSTT